MNHYDPMTAAAASDPDDITEPITAWAVYRYEELERREIGGKQVPLYVLRRAAGGFATEQAANAERDTLAMIEFLASYVVLADRGDLWGT